MKEQIKYKDLSCWLKLAIIIAWTEGIILGLSFLIGLIEGL